MADDQHARRAGVAPSGVPPFFWAQDRVNANGPARADAHVQQGLERLCEVLARLALEQGGAGGEP
jgi:hypothetical protein